MRSRSVETRRCWWLVVVLAFIHVDSARAEAPNLAKQVLILYETTRTSQLVVVSDREIPAILGSNSSEGVDYYAEFVDQNMFGRRDYQLAFIDILVSKCQGMRVALSITMTDTALEFV